MNDIKDWIDFVESFPITPYWRWSKKSWSRWRETLETHGIHCCCDRHGNVLLGADTVEDWYAQLQNISLCFQAHLDHPGGVVGNAVEKCSQGYRAQAAIAGGLSNRRRGAQAALFNAAGEYIEKVLIDKSFEGINEEWVSFVTSSANAAGGYLVGPSENSSQREGVLTGWGLDDHVGCAVILDAFYRCEKGDFVGVLTLDEEIGGYGLKYIHEQSKHFDFPVSRWPHLLSIEVTPEYPELNFICGNGPRFRSADARATLDLPVDAQLGDGGVALEKGACEASLHRLAGGRASCLVIPCKYAHNGLFENEWRAEEVDESDLNQLLGIVSRVADTEIKFHHACGVEKKVRMKVQGQGADEVVIHDHFDSLRVLCHEGVDYLQCLQSILPEWNKAHYNNGIELVKFGNSDWPYWRSWISRSADIAREISERAPVLNDRVRQFLQIPVGSRKNPDIHLFLGAPFNACNLAHGIGFSMEKIEPDDLERLLVHELTHWWMDTELSKLALRPLWKTTLHEGLACAATVSLLGITPAHALNIDNERYASFEKNYGVVHRKFLQWSEGKLTSVVDGRHPYLQKLDIPHPFHVSNAGEWKKYGYFVGYKLFESLSSSQWIDFLRNTSNMALNERIGGVSGG